MLIGNKNFDLDNNCYIMGILNVTPDSFSDGGKFNNIDSALRHTEQMINDGMDILDIGGESTRPDYTKISDEEEISRIVPVIEAVKQRFDIPVSLDTYKHRVAEAGINAGADLINDIWGLKYDGGEMAELIAGKNIPCCLMHNRKNKYYINFMEDVISDMKQTTDIALRAGIKKDNIILDIGVGFAKSYENNLESIDRIDEFRERLGYPVLLGTSRKSVIGLALGLPADQRTEGTLATTVAGVMKGVSIVRVHDVKENARAVKMITAVMKGY
ncbi:MAG: dihydropteroate synthase [Ruminococcus flavefaciens]|nr:dihydropteroate synthase [Ruminococcus flavefaciens]